MFSLFPDENGEKRIPAVYRRGPGCCGNDGWGGFLLFYDGELPKENDWIEVVGTPEIVKKDQFVELFLNVTSIQVLNQRGSEFVEQ